MIFRTDLTSSQWIMTEKVKKDTHFRLFSIFVSPNVTIGQINHAIFKSDKVKLSWLSL
jgi:hypothetical protein